VAVVPIESSDQCGSNGCKMVSIGAILAELWLFRL
jgi:hypothetical protein